MSDRRSIVSSLIVVAALLGLVAGFMIGRAGDGTEAASRPNPLEPSLQSGEPPVASVSFATRAVLGHTRDDGVSYWEFVRARLSRICNVAAPQLSTFRPSASPDGPSSSGAYLWIVSVQVLAQECAGVPDRNVDIGAVWSDTGELVAVGFKDPKITRDPSGRPERNQRPPNDAWLLEFDAGARP